jgi:hypothetical protein
MVVSFVGGKIRFLPKKPCLDARLPTGVSPPRSPAYFVHYQPSKPKKKTNSWSTFSSFELVAGIHFCGMERISSINASSMDG